MPVRLALVVALSALILAASSSAAEPRASGTAALERRYAIDIALDRAELKVTRADVLRAENRVQTGLTSCLTSDLVQITEAEQSNPNAQKALLSISEEAGAQYEIGALKPVLGPLLAGVRRLLTLPLPAKSRAAARTYLTGLTEVQSLNACADAQAWLSAGLTAGQEPSGTALTPAALADLRKLTNQSDPSGGTGEGLTPDQLQMIKADKKLTAKHLQQLVTETERSLESWIEQLSVSIDRTATTTQTSTTGTQTTAA